MHSRLKIKLAAASAIIILVGLRAWWVAPEHLPGGPLLEEIEDGHEDYTLRPKKGVRLSSMVKLSVFRGYSPEEHLDYKRSLEHLPSRYVSSHDGYFYVEYVTPTGRMQFHSGYHPDWGGSDWVELFPTDLHVDRFFDPSIAVSFDLNRPNFKVYINAEAEGQRMTVYVHDRMVRQIAWLDR